MSAAEPVDLDATIERIGIGRLALVAIILCFVMMVADGYDFATLSVAAPAILREWQIQPREMGAVFSLTFFGLLTGSLIYGWLADHWGRRPTIILGALNFSIPVLLTVWTTTTNELMLLRFVGGIGMGGIVPIAYTLVSEYAPRRFRSTVTVLTNAGYSVGATITGIVAAFCIPHFGWQSLFIVGAGLSLVLAIVLFAYLPESILFLATQRPASARLRPLLQRLTGEPIPAGTCVVAAHPDDATRRSGREAHILQLFAGPRAAATILLWLLFVVDSLGFFFLASWLPVVMEAAGASHGTASLAQSLFTFAGMCGGLAIMRFLDRLGPVAVVALPIIGAPAEILLGTPGLAHPVLLSLVAVAGAALSGIHYAVYAIVVRFYPPSIRGRGVSLATVFGRAGGIVAPYIGGYLLSAHMPLQELMMLAAIPCVGVAIVGIALGGLYRRHFISEGLLVLAPGAAGMAPRVPIDG
jgi:AAHS family 4-hydroxybenzoate transporter-like MFS transporter